MSLHTTFHQFSLSIVRLIFCFHIQNTPLQFFPFFNGLLWLFKPLGELFAASFGFHLARVFDSGLAHGKSERKATFVEEGPILDS